MWIEVLGVALAWVAVGVAVGVWMGRRGHAVAGWTVVGVVFGFFSVPVAWAAVRQEVRDSRRVVVPGNVQAGAVDVLVGLDGSRESELALDEVVALFGPRIRRLTLATVVDYEAGDPNASEVSRAVLAEAEERIVRESRHAAALEPELVVLSGAAGPVLAAYARDARFDVVAVGARGRRASRAVLGSTTAWLTKESPVPVLVTGEGVAPGRGHVVEVGATV